MGVLDHLTPQPVFHFFEELSKIPHGSGNVRAISDYLADFAKRRGYETVQDEACNVLVRLPATPGREALAPLMLQGHMDMVAVKEADCGIDLTRDPLRLRVDGDLLLAEGTSLGGDDGIAIAYFCALMDDPSIAHPPLYLLMTTDEETGMDGARALDPALLKARYFVNIDSEEEGVLLAGCAGGGRVHLALPIALRTVAGTLLVVRVCGLRGGHSGTEIVRERGNANLIAGRLLQALIDADCRFAVQELAGGVADNAIPAEAVIKLILPAEEQEEFDKIASVIKKLEADLRAELGQKDPALRIEVQRPESDERSGGRFPVSPADGRRCLTADAAACAAALLLTLPNGVQAMSADMAGLPETSLNLGVMRTILSGGGGDDGLPEAPDGSAEAPEGSSEAPDGQIAALHLDFSVRSSRETARDLLIRRLTLLGARFGASASVHGLYPGWIYDPASALCRHFAAVYRKREGKEARVEAIHAGVECGLFKEKRPDLDCLSLGPDLEEVHSTAERLHIASAGRVWDYLLEALAGWDIKE